MAAAKKKPAVVNDVEVDVLFECMINNIWTSRGKVKFGGSMMLPPDEAKFLKACQQKKLKQVMEGSKHVIKE